MKLDEELVEKLIYDILECAEAEQWRIAYFGRSFDGPDCVQVGDRKFASTNEEMLTANEAFERMRDEFDWVRHQEGVWYKVTTEGRTALAEKRRGATVSMSTLKLASITYNPDQTKAVLSWAKGNGMEIIYQYYPQATFPNNIAKVLANNEAVLGLHANGFVIPEQQMFKPSVLKDLFVLLTENHFYLFSTDHGAEPLTEEEIEKLVPAAAPASPVVSYTTNFYNSGASINLAAGAKADTIKQINNHIQTIEQQTPSVAKAIQDVTDAVEVAELPDQEKEMELERLTEISAEVAKPEAERKGWKVKERFEGLMNSVAKGAEVAGKVGEAYLKLQPIVDALGKALGGGG